MDPAAALAAFQQQIAQLQQQLAHQSLMGQAAPVAAVARFDRPRLPPPAQYDGRSSSALDGWLRELQQQFDWYATNDDASRLRFAGALLKGTALDWWASLVDAGAGAPATESTKPATYTEFVAR